MRKEYKKELEDLEYLMQKAEKFARKIPMFSETILKRKLTGSEDWITFSNKYKNLYLNWGIGRGEFEKGTIRELTNYKGKPYKKYLFSIYINTISLYDSHVKFGLEEIQNKVPVFFYDIHNSHFYATDDQIEPLLDALVEWYTRAASLIVEDNKETSIKALKDKLKILEGT